MISTRLRLIGWLLFFIPLLSTAQTVYVIDRIEVGLHAENDLDSPIIKIISTGTELQVLQQTTELSQVTDPEGTTGWINNTYIIDNEPGSTAILTETVIDSALQEELEQAKVEIADLKSQLLTAVSENESAEQIKSLRLEIGELKAENTQLRLQTNEQQNNDELYARIAQIEQEKLELAEMVNKLKNPINSNDSMQENVIAIFTRINWIYLLIALIIGAVLGMVIFDFINRQRHGGFRI